MAHLISYRQVIDYPTSEVGITLLVSLAYDQQALSVETKLDTGAAYCLFERKYAQRLGIEVESGQPLRMTTLTGSFLAYGHELTLWVLDRPFELTVYFAADENIHRNLLGRNWMQLVRVGVVDYDGKLFLSAYDDEL